MIHEKNNVYVNETGTDKSKMRKLEDLDEVVLPTTFITENTR